MAAADWPDETFSLSGLGLQTGDSIELTDLRFTAQSLGPVLIGAVWERGQREPLLLVTNLDFLLVTNLDFLLVTNLDFLHEARLWYKKRFGIETFFSDQKSRGFYLCHSHRNDPAQLCRLLIATCLAYLPGLLAWLTMGWSAWVQKWCNAAGRASSTEVSAVA